MEKLIKQYQDEVDAAQKFADLVAGEKIIHGMACYRTLKGEIHYIVINASDISTIIGLMEHSKIEIIKSWGKKNESY